MKEFKCAGSARVERLHEELQAAGVAVVTVRGSHLEMGGPAFEFTVVTEDGAAEPQVRAIVDAHRS